MSTLDLTAAAFKQRRPTSKGSYTWVDRFRARFDYLYQGLGVLATETSTDVWSITAYPGIVTIHVDDFNASDLQFYGGQSYFVQNSLADALDTAGYTVIGPGFSSGFSTGFDIA